MLIVLKKIKILLIIFILLLTVFLVNKFFYDEVKNAVFIISEPLQKFFWQKHNILSEWFSGILISQTVKIENQELKEENFLLKAKLLELKELERENIDLRKVLDLGLKKKFKLLLAEVISKKSEGDFILINRGKEDGISEGMAAITSGNVLIGRVEKVFDNFAQIQLVSDKDFIFSVNIGGEKEAILGAARGEGNFRIKIELLPKEAQINQGDIAATSLLGGIFPENLLVGEIKVIKKSGPEPFQEGEIEPYFSKLNLTRLFVIIP